jgi:hypothetical protein
MRQAFAHEALLAMGEEADERAPGAAVTVALCGHWEHQPPCPLAPHHVRAERVEDGLHLRVLFAADSENEPEVRRRIDRALSGQWPLPNGFTPSWRLRRSWPSAVSPDEADHAERLILS